MPRPDRRLVGLLLLAAIPAAVESGILTGIGFTAAQGFAPQITAVWPYGAFHDLRWLLTYHDSWQLFLAEWVLAVGLRGLLNASLIALAWPAGSAGRPAFRRLFARSLMITAVVSAILSPWAALAVAASVVALSWYLFASVLPILLLSPFLQRVGAGVDWQRGLPSIELVGWSLLGFVLLTFDGALIWTVPDWLNAPTAAAAGVLNGLLWQRCVHAAVLPRRVRWRRVPVAPIAVLLVLLAPLAVRGATAAKTSTQGEWQIPILTRRLPDTVQHAIIAIAGYDSRYRGEPAVDPNVERFSYRGLNAGGSPLPYEPRATHRSLESSTDLLAAQVASVHRRTHLPVALIGQSEGAAVARLLLERHPGTAVDTVLLFSPLIRAGRGYYPPAQADHGWGLVAGWEIRGLFFVTNLVNSVKDNPDEPFVRSLLDGAPFWRNRAMCPVPGVRMIAFIPTASAAEAPPGQYTAIPVYQLPSFHGGMLGRPLVHDRILGFLGGEEINKPVREYTFLQRLAGAWQAPPLALSVNPVWRHDAPRTPAFGGRICQP